MQQQPVPTPPERPPSEQQSPCETYTSYPVSSGGIVSPFPSPQPQSAKKIARKYGLIFGAIAIGIYILRSVIGQWFTRYLFQHDFSTATINLYSLALFVVSTMIYWSIYFLTGFLTARRVQRVVTAIIACLWVSLCLFGIYCLFYSYNTIRFFAEYRGPYVESFTSIAIKVGLFLVLEVGLGIGIGTFAGLLGYRKQTPPVPPRYPRSLKKTGEDTEQQTN
jgi:hypothetical protein